MGIQSSVFHTRLPAEVTTYIFAYFSLEELLTASLACKLFLEIASDNALWKNLCFRANRNVVCFSPRSWKEFYRKTSFPAVKKAFEQAIDKPNPQPIAQSESKYKVVSGVPVLDTKFNRVVQGKFLIPFRGFLKGTGDEKAFEQSRRAQVFSQSIDEEAHDYKLNGKEGLAILTSDKKAVYKNFSQKNIIENKISLGDATQALFDGHWLISSSGSIDEHDLETGKKKHTFEIHRRIKSIAGFQHLFTFTAKKISSHEGMKIHVWDVRESGKIPCVEIPVSNFPEKLRILHLEQILETSDSSKMSIIDIRNSSPVQTIAPPDHSKKPKNLKISSIANEEDRIIVSYDSGMLAEFNLSRNEFTLIHDATMSSPEKFMYGKVMPSPIRSYYRLEACDSIIVGEVIERDLSSYVHFIHRYSFKILGKLTFSSLLNPWDYQDKRFVYKSRRNKSIIRNF